VLQFILVNSAVPPVADLQLALDSARKRLHTGVRNVWGSDLDQGAPSLSIADSTVVALRKRTLDSSMSCGHSFCHPAIKNDSSAILGVGLGVLLNSCNNLAMAESTPGKA
jgi:hypothetical protein